MCASIRHSGYPPRGKLPRCVRNDSAIRPGRLRPRLFWHVRSHVVTTMFDRVRVRIPSTRHRCRWGQSMELSIREAKARFAEAAAAAARGERVVVTKHGRPFVELVSVRRVSGMDFEKAAIVRRELGLDGLTVSLPANFDDPAFSRQVIGLEE